MSTAPGRPITAPVLHVPALRHCLTLAVVAGVSLAAGACDKTYFREAQDDDDTALPVFGISQEDNTSALILDIQEYGPSPTGWCISIQTTGGTILSVDESSDHACISVVPDSWDNFDAPVSYPALGSTTMPILFAELSPGMCFSADGGAIDASADASPEAGAIDASVASQVDQERWMRCGASTPIRSLAWPPQPVVPAVDAGPGEAGSASSSSSASGSSTSASSTSSTSSGASSAASSSSSSSASAVSSSSGSSQ